MKEKIDFYKMEGAGNDFIVFDNREYSFTKERIIELAPCLCNRKFGIGADGLLVLDYSQVKGADFTMIYRNADGSDAGMCGNGARCIARFAHSLGFPALQSFNVHDNVYKAEVSEEEISIHFPVSVKTEYISINGQKFIRADAATEHLILVVEKSLLMNENELRLKGKEIRNSKEVQPKGTNVNFISIEDKNSINLQTYERGVEDLTLACGTGSLASGIASHFHSGSNEKESEYTVKVKGGTLKTRFNYDKEQDVYSNLILTGPAHFVFKGSIQL